MADMNISTKAVQNITLGYQKRCQVDICFKAPHFVSLEGLVFPQDFSRQYLGPTLFPLECTSKLSMVSNWLISPACRALSRKKTKRYKKLTTVCGL